MKYLIIIFLLITTTASGAVIRSATLQSAVIERQVVAGTDSLLLEIGDYLLLETGDRLLLE